MSLISAAIAWVRRLSAELTVHSRGQWTVANVHSTTVARQFKLNVTSAAAAAAALFESLLPAH